jgi:serine/threonine protein kinase/tetratricopeptide (TPR) repeat protein
MAHCPSAEQLHVLLAEDASGPAVERLLVHVQHCTGCQELLERLTSAANQFSEQLPMARACAHPDDGEPDVQFLEQLRQALPRPNRCCPVEPEVGPESVRRLAQDTPGSASPQSRTATGGLLEPPPKLAGYEILRELGRGGMGVVYEARQLSLDRPVALKMLLNGPHAAPHSLARFRREAEIIARLHHPQIVQIYEIGTQDGRPFFSMEFVAGGNLAEHLAGTPQDPRSAAQLVQNLAQALQVMHREGIIHRDLKPANILLQRIITAEDAEERRGKPTDLLPLRSSVSSVVKDFFPKITDFGLAKQVALSPQGTVPGGLTGSEAVLGTPSYMAPEQAQTNATGMGPWTDIYALGAILYELLTGRPPFRAAASLDTVLQVLYAEPVPPRRFQPAVPRDLETICLKCLHKEPRRRYSAAQALAEDLGRFLAGEPIRARPIGWWGQAWRWARRRPAVAALAGVSALAGLGLVAGGLWHYHEQTEAFRRTEWVVQEALDTMSRLVRLDDGTAERLQPEEFRRRLGKEVGAFYEHLLANAEKQGESVRRRIGTIHFDLAKIHEFLGQPEQTLTQLHEACALQEQLVAAYPDKADYRAELVLTYLNLGMFFSESRRLSEAEEWLAKARDLCEPLVSQHPDVPAYQSRLAQCYHDLASHCLFKADHAAAQAAFEKAVALTDRLVHDHPGVAAYRYALAEHHINLVLAYGGLGKQDQALASADQAIRLLEALRQEDPQYPDYAHRLASAYMNRGCVAITTGQPERALESYTRAVDMLEPWHRKAPQWARFRLELAAAHGGTADALMHLNRPAESLSHWRRLLELDQGPQRHLNRLRYSLALVQAGDYAAAAAEGEALAASANVSADILYNVACLYSLCSRAVAADERLSLDDRERLAEHYAVRAITALSKADAAGMFQSQANRQHFKEDPDFLPLRPRKDFQKLLKAVEHRAP